MPILHCTDCHHEWEGSADSVCAWCGAGSRILAPLSELEESIKSGHSRRIVDEMLAKIRGDK